MIFTRKIIVFAFALISSSLLATSNDREVLDNEPGFKGSNYTNEGFELKFNISLPNGTIYTPSMKVLNNKEARLTYLSDENLAVKNNVQLRVISSGARYNNRNVAVLKLQLLQMTESNWSILSEGDLVGYLEQPASMSLQGISGEVKIEVTPSAMVYTDVEVTHALSQNCDNLEGMSKKIELNSFDKKPIVTKLLPSGKNCCSAACSDGSGNTMTCCGAASCSACGVSCSP